MRLLYILAWVCVGIALLLAVGRTRQVSAGPLEIRNSGMQVTCGEFILYRDYRIIYRGTLAAMAVPMVLPLVVWIVLAERRSKRRDFPVDATKVDA